MKHYVTGFLISTDKQSVVLIRKIAPAWQKGWFNGVGGKIETDETPSDAMVREFREEAGVETNVSCWKPFVKLVRPDEYIVHFFVNRTDSLTRVRSMETEQISIQAVSALPDKVLPNLRWLIPMCLDDELNFDEPIVVTEIEGVRDHVQSTMGRVLER